jgi:hypothetical protein
MESMSTTNEPREIFAIAGEYVDEIAALDPFEATGMGVVGHDHEVTDFSPDALSQRVALIRRTLGRLDHATPLDGDEAVARAVMRDALGDELDRIEAGDPFYELNTIVSPLQRLRDVFDLMPLATEQDWQAVIQRLNALPDSAASIEARLTEGVRSGRVVARRQVEEVLAQLTRFAGDDAAVAPAFAGLPEQLARSGVETETLRRDLERGLGGAGRRSERCGRFWRRGIWARRRLRRPPAASGMPARRGSSWASTLTWRRRMPGAGRRWRGWPQRCARRPAASRRGRRCARRRRSWTPTPTGRLRARRR